MQTETIAIVKDKDYLLGVFFWFIYVPNCMFLLKVYLLTFKSSIPLTNVHILVSSHQITIIMPPQAVKGPLVRGFTLDWGSDKL